MAQYMEFWRKYMDFAGVSSRRAYWIPTIVNGILGLSAFIALMSLSGHGATPGLIALITFAVAYFLAAVIPSLSVQVRRLHDSNRSGLWLAATLVPIVGDVTLLALSLMPTVKEGNRYR